MNWRYCAWLQSYTHTRRVGHAVCAWEQSQAKSRTAPLSDLTQMVTSKEKLKAPDSSPLCFTCMSLEQRCSSVCLLCKQSCQEGGSMARWCVQLGRLFEKSQSAATATSPFLSTDVCQLVVRLDFCMFFKIAACVRWTVLFFLSTRRLEKGNAVFFFGLFSGSPQSQARCRCCSWRCCVCSVCCSRYLVQRWEQK